MRILVPLDGSALAERALMPAMQFLRTTRETASLSLIRVVPYPSVLMNLPGDYTVIADEHLLAGETATAQHYLDGVAARDLFKGISVTTSVSYGSPAESIVAQAHVLKADLIVMNSHGHNGLARLALGSIAEAVAREGRVPTLIVRGPAIDLDTADRATPLTLLIPLDGSELAERAIEPAARIARMTQGALRLMRVMPAQIAPLEREQERSHAAYAYLQQIAAPLEREGITIHQALAWGNPADEIVREAEQTETDIVVLATHGRVGLDRFLNGSVTEAVLHRLDVPVLIYHPLPMAVV